MGMITNPDRSLHGSFFFIDRPVSSWQCGNTEGEYRYLIEIKDTKYDQHEKSLGLLSTHRWLAQSYSYVDSSLTYDALTIYSGVAVFDYTNSWLLSYLKSWDIYWL